MDTTSDARVGDMDIKTEKIKDLSLHPDNPRQGDIGAIAVSIEQNGWYGTVVAQKSTGHVLAGNHRLQAAQQLGLKEVPVYWVDVDDTTAKKILLADNRTNDLAIYNDDTLSELLTDLSSTGDLLGTGYDGDDVDQLLADLSTNFDDPFNVSEEPPDGSLHHNIDVFVNMAPQLCKIAEACGLRTGVISTTASQRYYDKTKLLNLSVDFLDNEFTDYNHEKHVEAVKLFTPQYATVRDLMTKKQCKEAGNEYYSFEQIMEWAEEVDEHAENVIVIPKYDCIEDIPEKFMLGYSIPSSYGGTPLPLEAFKGRRVHLLGGNWKRQLGALGVLEEDVVSLDNNHMAKIAAFGTFYGLGGKELNAKEELAQYGGYYGYIVPYILSIMRMVTDLNRMGCSVNGRRMSVANDEGEAISFGDLGGWEQEDFKQSERDTDE